MTPTVPTHRPVRMIVRGGPGTLAAAMLLAAALSACTLHNGPNLAAAPPTAAGENSAHASVKTVRRSAAAGEDQLAEAPASAIPAPRQIFDFHPAGAKPDDWRPPFIIDPNDGPLAADVRRSTAELRSYLAATAHDVRPAVVRRCGETDVATAKPGCAGPATTGTIPKPPGAPASPSP